MRPKKTGEKKTEPITIKTTPAVKTRVQKIAESEDRTISQIVGLLLERGLAGYERDGVLIGNWDSLDDIAGRVLTANQKAVDNGKSKGNKGRTSI